MKYILAVLISAQLLLACGGNQSPAVESAPPAGTAPAGAKREVAAPETPPAGASRSALQPDTTPPYKPVPHNGESYHPAKAAPPMSAPAFAQQAGIPQGFVELAQLDSSILLDIRYATTNNFTETKIYDCPRCLLRIETARALMRAQRILQQQGLRLKMFDCYRPGPYQQRLWDKVPNPDYVTPPEEGSMHSRGAAVDLTIADAQGNELDMGTPYDFFGREAHANYTNLPATALNNRRLLRRTMEAVGLKGIRTEWWHFSYQRKSFPLSDWVWECSGN